jgi:DNA recombination protein RmuC
MNEITFLIIGLILGLLICFVFFFISKKKQNPMEESNFNELDIKLKTFLNEWSEFKTKDIQDRAKIDQVVKDMRQGVLDVNTIAENLKTTLVSGGSQQQGRWGELVLQNILDSIGFRKGEEYDIQKIIKGDDGKDQKPKKEALAEHVAAVKNHIKELAKRDYQKSENVNSLDSVIMFTPSEQSITALGPQYKEIMSLGFASKVFIVGPTSLYFTLKTVEYHWKVEKNEKNYKKIISMFDKMASQSVEIYNSAKDLQKYLEKALGSIQNMLNQIRDGRQSFLGRIDKIVKFGGITPKKQIPEEAKDYINNESQTENNTTSISAKKSDD